MADLDIVLWPVKMMLSILIFMNAEVTHNTAVVKKKCALRIYFFENLCKIYS